MFIEICSSQSIAMAKTGDNISRYGCDKEFLKSAIWLLRRYYYGVCGKRSFEN